MSDPGDELWDHDDYPPNFGEGRMDPRQEAYIDYTNWRGERSYRRIQPLHLSFENNEWHPQTQWMVAAVDLDKDEERMFALSGIHQWFSAEEINKAKEFVKEKPSTSFLQRKLQIGYNRAGSIMQMFEDNGLVSAPSASGVRAVL